MDLGLADARVLVVGGSRGMGRAAAETFAREGARVAVLARASEALDDTVSTLAPLGSPDSVPLAADLTSLSEVDSAIDGLGDRWDALEVLVNTAGPVDVGIGRFDRLDDDEWRDTFDIGVFSAVRTVRRSLPLLRRGSFARIVNVSAHSTKRQSPDLVAYTAAKAALSSLTKNLSQWLAPEGILVNTVSPGSFLSEGHAGLPPNPPSRTWCGQHQPHRRHAGHRGGFRSPRLSGSSRQPGRDRACHRISRLAPEQLHDRSRCERRRWIRFHLNPAGTLPAEDVRRDVGPKAPLRGRVRLVLGELDHHTSTSAPADPVPSQKGSLLFAEQHTSGPTIGVIGLGTIGGGIASNVHAAGLPLVVCDVRAEATHKHADYATVAGSPADLARESDIVVVAVVNDEQVRAVLSGPNGALAAGGTGTTVVVVSTITSACVAAIGAEATALRRAHHRLRRQRWPNGGGGRQPGLHVWGRP